MIKVFVQRGKLFEKVPDLVLQLGAKQGFSRFDCPGTADLSLPGEIGSQSRRIRHLWALVALGSNGNPCCRFRSTNQLQKFLGFCRNSLAEGFENAGGGLPVEEAVGCSLRGDLKVQAGILGPPLYLLTDAQPQAFLVGRGRVQPGVPVDAADLQNVAGLVEKGLKYRLPQCQRIVTTSSERKDARISLRR